MGIFDVLSGHENPADFIANSAVKGIKAAGKGLKSGVEKAKETREAKMAADDDSYAGPVAGPKFCPHCGKPLR
jgi:hypothetical protein